jgi:hypothetical protein
MTNIFQCDSDARLAHISQGKTIQVISHKDIGVATIEDCSTISMKEIN